MSTLTEVRAGDIMFGPIGGFIPGVFPVGIGQLLLKAATRETWRVRHVAVVVEDWIGSGIPRIVQAMPHGAEEIGIGPEHFSNDYVYVRPAYMSGMELDVPYSGTQQGCMVAQHARAYIDTPYSFLDYVALAGLHLGIKNGPVRRYVRSSGHMICSQLADQALTDAGWHTFADGRLPQDVMPADLFRKLLSMPGRHRTGCDADWTPNAVTGGDDHEDVA